MGILKHHKIYLSGTRKTALELARGRLVLVSIFFVFVYVVVLARVVDLSIIQGVLQPVQEESVYEAVSVQDDQVNRADIVDRNGVLLARSLSTASLYADPKMIQDPAAVAKDIVSAFPDLTYGDVLKKLQSKKRFVWLKRNISPDDQVKVLYMGYPGLNFKVEKRRIYPQGSLAAHVVGLSGIDEQGLSGVEASFNDLLQKDVSPLELTLDVRVQHILKREISNVIKRHKAVAGAGVVMDVETGEILAAVSLPDFDPHEYAEAKEMEKFNRFSLGVYELGSSLKIFSTAALLENNNGNMAQRFDVRKPIEVGRFKIRDYHPEKRILTLPEVFIHSSNIGSAMMGQAVGSEKLKDFYKDVGLFNASALEIPEIGSPLVPDPWREVNTMTAAFGHGIAVSPLQLVRAASSIINGGILVTPTIIKSQKGHSKASEKSALRVVSPETSHRMRQLMRLVVSEGTGKQAEVNGFLVGGKTGTAEKPGKSGYRRDKLISSFLGVFPMDAPRYAVFVMIDEPKGIKETYGYATGGWVGAPAVGRIISSMTSVLGLSPSTKKGFESSLMKYVKTKEQIKEEQKIAAH